MGGKPVYDKAISFMASVLQSDKKLLLDKTLRQEQIGLKYGVNRRTISAINMRVSWEWLEA